MALVAIDRRCASCFGFPLRVLVRTAIALKMEKIREAYHRFGWTSKKESGIEITWAVGGAVMVQRKCNWTAVGGRGDLVVAA